MHKGFVFLKQPSSVEIPQYPISNYAAQWKKQNKRVLLAQKRICRLMEWRLWNNRTQLQPLHFDKFERNIHRRMSVSLSDSARKTGFPYTEEWNYTHVSYPTGDSIKMDQRLNVRPRTMRLVEENKYTKYCWIETLMRIFWMEFQPDRK